MIFISATLRVLKLILFDPKQKEGLLQTSVPHTRPYEHFNTQQHRNVEHQNFRIFPQILFNYFFKIRVQTNAVSLHDTQRLVLELRCSLCET